MLVYPSACPEPTPSLLLLARFGPASPGTGGVRPFDGRPPSGTGGAVPSEDPDEIDFGGPRTGADRSLVTAFFNLVPLVISVRRAP